MHLPNSLLSLLLLLLPTSHAAPTKSQSLIAQPADDTTTSGFKIPTRYESTVLARRLLALSSTGVISTIFPPNSSDSNPRLPPGLSSVPIALPDYIASCEETSHPGDPTLLALTISTTTKNAYAGSNVSLALSWWDSYKELTGREPWSAANLPRASLIGYLEEISGVEVEDEGLVECFTGVHRDSRFWLPGDESSPHTGIWMRMVVEQVYWIGGFGDRAFIGWFDVEEWKGVGSGEWTAVKLPGE
jgi:hypothetical protein